MTRPCRATLKLAVGPVSVEFERSPRELRLLQDAWEIYAVFPGERQFLQRSFAQSLPVPDDISMFREIATWALANHRLAFGARLRRLGDQALAGGLPELSQDEISQRVAESRGGVA